MKRFDPDHRWTPKSDHSIPSMLSHCPLGERSGREAQLSPAVRRKDRLRDELEAKLPNRNSLEMSSSAIHWPFWRGGICKQRRNTKEKGEASRATSGTFRLREQLGPWAAWVWDTVWLGEGGARPLKFLNILGFPGFHISTFNCCVKMDCCHYNKALLNPERTAPSVKKSFSLVSF